MVFGPKSQKLTKITMFLYVFLFEVIKTNIEPIINFKAHLRQPLLLSLKTDLVDQVISSLDLLCS